MLICPGCQDAGDWTADLDRCPSCGGTSLVRRLGETECRDCGTVGTGAQADAASASESGDPGAELAREVEQALARVLGRASVR